MTQKEIRIGLVAGGSGGHMFPAFAVAQEAVRQGALCSLLTDARGARFLGDYGNLFQEVCVLPSQRSWLGIPYIASVIKWVVKNSVILGFGGYMTVSPLLVAKILGRVCGIHQSDVIMGKANRWLSRWAHGIFVTHKETGEKYPRAQCIGTPVRDGVNAIPPMEVSVFDDGCPMNILILGGSQGATFWSSVIPQGIALLSREDKNRLQIVHQCRPEDEKETVQAYVQAGMSSVTVCPFIQDIIPEIARAHLVFTRAGASTLAELGMAGRPCFMVPYPYAADNHQWINAEAVADQGGGWLCSQDEVTPEKIMLFVTNCLHNPSQLLYAGSNAQRLFPAYAARQLVQFCLSS